MKCVKFPAVVPEGEDGPVSPNSSHPERPAAPSFWHDQTDKPASLV